MATPQSGKVARLRSYDEWVLILYDALRHDTFDYFMGDVPVQETVSPATGTHYWFEELWSDDYDVCYVTGSPLTGEHNEVTYNAGEHFDTTREVWKDEWDSDLGTIPPEPITAVAREALDVHEKVLVHYVQPHAPYIGEEQIIEQDDPAGALVADPRDDADGPGVFLEIHERVQNGELSLETVRRAYYDNLIRVVDGSRALLEQSARRTVITSDHGECLGEHVIGHNYDCDHVRVVPWYEL